MKRILFGIALILFGFNCTYVAGQAGWYGIDILGICFSVLGLIISIIGVMENEK
jgi:hypothetical protein